MFCRESSAREISAARPQIPIKHAQSIFDMPKTKCLYCDTPNPYLIYPRLKRLFCDQVRDGLPALCGCADIVVRNKAERVRAMLV